jgi:2-methylcitrate dehydratase PrpD
MTERIFWESDPAQDRHGTLEPGSLTIYTKDGSAITHTAEVARGHPSKPMTETQLRQKFFDCMAGYAPLTARADELYEAVKRLPETEVVDLAALLRP